MPIFRLSSECVFPPVELADDMGIIALGGDLSPERLLVGYQNGIFPWYSEGEPILWWSPDPRFVIYPQDVHISKSMRRVLNQQVYQITYDKEFERVMQSCSCPRPKQLGTWILPEMIEAYTVLHRLGYAHSVEAWHNGELVGGLYGVSLGRVFFGESMFSIMDNASKAAFITLSKRLVELDFMLIDSQVHTPHLESLGAISIPRREFMTILHQALQFPTVKKFD